MTTSNRAEARTPLRRVSKTMGLRAVTATGALALLAGTGAGMAGTANAATSSSATSTLAKIKYCESGGNYQAVNSSSGASGAYQFLDSTWKGLSAASGYATAASAPASVQDAAAQELYAQAGTSPWASSSSCWSSMTSAPAASSSASSTSSSTSTAAKTASATTTTSNTRTAARTANTKAAPTPHGKPGNAAAPRDGHGAPHGKHAAKPAAPKPPKQVGNTMPASAPKPAPGAQAPGHSRTASQGAHGHHAQHGHSAELGKRAVLHAPAHA